MWICGKVALKDIGKLKWPIPHVFHGWKCGYRGRTECAQSYAQPSIEQTKWRVNLAVTQKSLLLDIWGQLALPPNGHILQNFLFFFKSVESRDECNKWRIFFFFFKEVTRVECYYFLIGNYVLVSPL